VDLGLDSRNVQPDAVVIAGSLDRPEQFATIFERHFDAVHAYLSRRAGSTLADDLASSTFVVAFERRDGFRPEADSARPWLFGIATNLLRNQWRAARRTEEVVRKAGSAITGNQAPVPDALVEGYEEIAGALAGLDAGQRDALIMFAWEGLSYEEIATSLNVPVGTVRSRIARGRARLREKLTVTDVLTVTDAQLTEAQSLDGTASAWREEVQQ
jgi:RNA polymerase sigma-70 factor (ECF subfamily)